MSNCSDVPVTDGVWAHQLFNTYMTEFHSYSYRSLPLCSVLCLERTWWSGLCEGWWKHWCLVLCKKNPQLDHSQHPLPPSLSPKPISCVLQIFHIKWKSFMQVFPPEKSSVICQVHNWLFTAIWFFWELSFILSVLLI